ncbi:hypothetical protein F0U44_09390 [Nocardioides humilatus]|uniref:Uncharacterized protein n=1 Tax=Nocardioides humilatus TaxID=2607660 RepID=A0A5B1LFY8_9ACTN|nr:hypothetical protein [Nocardioides humilatus]KAA1418700.1 hypothetical protein F0U44_09390 [Nocardioides humilatus]
MELHESLYALGQSQGRELFNDADSFRGALDDYLDEDSATTGDINLLVDAVRLGAFQAMTTMLDSGADSDRAVSEAGARLARDRGSADVGGAMWALAVLGYAIGKVNDQQVRRYRTQHASSPAPPPAGPATMLPPTGLPSPGQPPMTSPGAPPPMSPPGPSAPAPAPTAPVWPSSGSSAPSYSPPPSAGAPSPVGAGSYGAPPPAATQTFSPYGQPPPAKKRKLWPIVVGVVAGVVLVGGGVVTVVALSGDDKKDPDDPKKSDSSATSDPTSEGPDVSFDALNTRYASLATMVTSGLDSCAAGTPQSGQTEKIECTFPQGTMVLTTYASDAELTAARRRHLNTAEGTIVSDVDSGAYYRFDPTTADPESTAAALVYWDSAAGKQSAEVTGSTGVSADQLDQTFEAVSATVTPPDGPTDLAVKDFNTLFGIVNCRRIPTETGGETEESECRRSGRRTWVGRFDKGADLRRYRTNAKTLTNQDGRLVVDYWYNDDNSNGQQDDDEPEQGKIYGYVEEQDSGSSFGVLYIDDFDCGCYLQMYDKGQGDPEKLYKLIF